MIPMRITWHGHSCFETGTDLTVITDPHNGSSIGIRPPFGKGDIILVSHNHHDHNSVRTVKKTDSVVITDPGNHRQDGVEISGFPAYHDDVQGDKRGEIVIFMWEQEGIRFCHLGDLGHGLDEDMISRIGAVDVLFVPVGGVFTIDAETAAKIVRRLGPSIAVPMHYKKGGLSLPINTEEPFLELMKDCSITRVGPAIDFDREDFVEKGTEIWVFSR